MSAVHAEPVATEPSEPSRPSGREVRVRRLLWGAIALLLLIAALAVLRRTLALFAVLPAGRAPGGEDFDAAFSGYRVLTLVHILPGLAFLGVGTLQLWSGLRRRRPGLHRVLGRLALALGLVTGLAALGMSARLAIGGANERAAITFFGSLFLLCLGCGYAQIRRRNRQAHREWMIRAYAIALAIATTRPIVALFFATSRRTGLSPHEFFGIAFWMGFTLHLVAAQAWIDATRRVPYFSTGAPGREV